METIDQDLNPTSNLITENAIKFLSETVKWSKFLSVLGFIMVGFMVIAALFMGTMIANLGGVGMKDGSMSDGVITVLYLILAAIYFFPVYYLFKFSQNLKEAISNESADSYEKAFEYQKSQYKFAGIMAIIVLSIYVIVFLVAIVGGLLASI
jgi:hypothetical protein|tara:strand:- start:177 stop:632 length:456 start_codon:yes stop_codon:yes gene_type:complete